MVDVQKMADSVFASVKGYVSSALKPFEDRLKALEAREPVAPEKGDKGEDGASVTVEDVAPLIADEVAKAVAALPPAEKGEDGKDADPVDVAALAAQAATEARAAATEWLKANPPKDGQDAKTYTPDEIREMFLPLFQAEQARWALEFERHAQGVLERAVDRLPKPKDGMDGLGFDDLQMHHDGERRFTVSYVQGDKTKAFDFRMPVVLYRGIFKDGGEYEQGDAVTWAGSLWIAQADTKSKPGLSDDWRLAVKKGRDLTK